MIRTSSRPRRFHLFALLFALSTLMGFYQNMSPFDGEDIRQRAPKEPAPLPEKVGFLPKDPHGRSPQALGEEILRHNFSGPLKDLEERFQDWMTVGAEGSADASAGVAVGGREPTSIRKYKLKAGIIGKAGLGVLYERDFKMKCEYSPAHQSFQVRFDQPLSANAHLTVQHNSEVQQSSIGFSYQW